MPITETAAAERLVRLSTIAFGEEGYATPVAAEEKKSGGFFRRRK